MTGNRLRQCQRAPKIRTGGSAFRKHWSERKSEQCHDPDESAQAHEIPFFLLSGNECLRMGAGQTLPIDAIRRAYSAVLRESSLMLSLILFQLSTALAAPPKGILPGEPDPNGPYTDNPSEQVLLDDRKPCPKGLTRYQRMKCALPEEADPDCQNYAPVFECLKSPIKITCEAPYIVRPVYHCLPPRNSK